MRAVGHPGIPEYHVWVAPFVRARRQKGIEVAAFQRRTSMFAGGSAIILRPCPVVQKVVDLLCWL